MSKDTAIEKLVQWDKDCVLMENIESILSWDQETYLPENAVADRANQLSFLAGEIHKRRTLPEIGDLMKVLGLKEEGSVDNSALSEKDQALLRETGRDYRQAVKLPEDFVREFTKQTSLGQQAWQKARQEDDFSLFQSNLETLVSLARKKADYLGYKDHPYDALLDCYEPGSTAAELERIFIPLKKDLGKILEEISVLPKVDDSAVNQEFDIPKQDAFGHRILADFGYDLKTGRMDISAHPFTITLGSKDVRITTRYMNQFFNAGIYSTVHECGHGLYEQGFRSDLEGTSLASGTSLGIHESQSRFWENIVARSSAFWEYYYPALQETFPEQTQGRSSGDFFKAVNKVVPSCIRVEADEVTYNLHIILRFEIEKALIAGEIEVRDLPDIWNSKMKELLDIVPGSDAQGVLQDVHWSFGLYGYFPTYSLGNLYSAQFAHSLEKELGPVSELVQKGDFKKILDWLRTNIHQWGRQKTALQLVQDITGEPLNPAYFTNYLKQKVGEVYKG